MMRARKETHPNCVVFLTMGAGAPVYTLSQQHPPRLSTMRTRGVTFLGGRS